MWIGHHRQALNSVRSLNWGIRPRVRLEKTCHDESTARLPSTADMPADGQHRRLVRQATFAEAAPNRRIRRRPDGRSTCGYLCIPQRRLCPGGGTSPGCAVRAVSTRRSRTSSCRIGERCRSRHPSRGPMGAPARRQLCIAGAMLGGPSYSAVITGIARARRWI